MPRRPSTKGTSIYWLLDVRPEILVDHPAGKPFYCGKTIFTVEQRLHDHMGRDSNRHPNRLIAKRLAECNGQVSFAVMEVVPAGGNWQDRERHWIRHIRFMHPDCVNMCAGGEGGAGCIPSEETRRKRSQSLRNSPAKRAETLRRTGVPTGQVHTAETKRRISEARRGTKASDETRAKMREAAKHKPPRTAEHIEKVARAHRGMKRSPECKRKISEAQKKHWATKPRQSRTEWSAYMHTARASNSHPEI